MESRRELKAKVEDLNAENTRLKAELDHSSQAETPPKLPIRRRGSSLCDILDKLAEDADTSADLSIQEIPRSSFASSQAKSKPPLSHLPDESLQVDMPDKSMRMKVESRKPHIESRSEPTARTYSFDLDEAKVKRKSKHFPSQPDDDGEDEDVIVGASSSSPSPAKRSRTNPFTTTREESEKRRVLPSKTHSSSSLGHPVDLVSPYKKPLTLAKDRNLLEKSSNSVVGWLGITDANGRPKKGVVGGVKVKRRV